MAAQKASHEFHMESLDEDHKCLMDLVDEMKAKTAAAEEEATKALTENNALKREVEAMEARRKAEEEEKNRHNASPHRFDALEQVRRVIDILYKFTRCVFHSNRYRNLFHPAINHAKTAAFPSNQFALILYVHMLQEKMALVARQTELLEQIDNYETGRQERDKLINELKSEVDKNNAGMRRCLP